MSGLLALNNIFVYDWIDFVFPLSLFVLSSRTFVLTLHIHGRLTCAAALLLLLRLGRVARDLLRVLAVVERRQLLHEARTTSG